MNITIITILLPFPLNSGGAQAQYNMIDLLRCKHHFTIIFPENKTNKLESMRILQKRWPEVEFYSYKYIHQLLYVPFLLSKARRAFGLIFTPDNKSFQRSRILKNYGYPINKDFVSFVNTKIRESHTDIIQVEFYQYLAIIDYLPKDRLKIFVHHEIRYIRNERLLRMYDISPRDKKKMELIKKEELLFLNKYDRIITLTNVDKQILEEEHVSPKLFVSPACVNTKRSIYKEWEKKLIFVGGFAHTPNEEGINWFLSEVVLMVPQANCSDLELLIVGSGWPESYNRIVNGLNVRCLGFVEDLSKIACGAIMIVPILSGSGMRMKILEAAALGLPILTTRVGVEGLLFRNNESCIISNKPDEFANSLVSIMTNEKLREKLTSSAADLYERNYSPQVLSEVRNNIYNHNFK